MQTTMPSVCQPRPQQPRQQPHGKAQRKQYGQPRSPEQA